MKTQTVKQVLRDFVPPILMRSRYQRKMKQKGHQQPSNYYDKRRQKAEGRGQMSRLLYDKRITHYLGFDFSHEAIGIAKEKNDDLITSEFNFEVADAFETKLYYSHSYDAVVCTEFLEHIESDLKVIEKIPTGKHFYGSVPNYGCRSHVRFFDSNDDVAERYRQYFHSFTVDCFNLSSSGDRAIYILSGITR